MQKIRKNGMWRRQQGFSLVELAVTIAIAAVIAAIVIPFGLSMRQRYQLRAAATDVMSTFKRAQSEAVKRNARVAITILAGTFTVFLDNGAVIVSPAFPSGFNPAQANDLVQNGLEQTLFTTTLQSGTSLTYGLLPAPTQLPLVTEFNSAGIPYTGGAVVLAAPVAINVVSSAGLSVQYQVWLNVTGHVNLLTSTDSGATFH
jgi:prepilin-type N-terminal cleavage/methylation domain-containing protein